MVKKLNRFIEFRSQDEEKNWHFGNYDKDNNEIFYTHTDNEGIYRVTIPIIPETVGEFVVLDSNKKPIYENDIVVCNNGLFDKVGIVKNFHLGWCVFNEDKLIGSLWDYFEFGKVKVIGNIFDNPKFLEE